MALVSAVQDAVHKIVRNENLTLEEAHGALDVVLRGEATDGQIGALLAGLRMKGETPAEIAGFVKAVCDRAVHVPTSREDIVDISGTGGDEADTFNISTAAALVAAGAGVPVGKQANRAVSSQSGSADVLRALGVGLNVTPAVIAECLDEIGIAFLHSPTLHPAMRYAITPRMDLALRTVFNVIGPLCNPLGAKRQVVGVFNAQYTELLATALQMLGAERVFVVHAMVGMDELSTCGDTQVTHVHSGDVSSTLWSPEQFGIEPAELEELAGGPPDRSATIINSVLNGEPGAARDIVVFNAAAAICVGGKATDVQEGILMAAEAIDSGVAAAKLAAVRELTALG